MDLKFVSLEGKRKRLCQLQKCFRKIPLDSKLNSTFLGLSSGKFPGTCSGISGKVVPYPYGIFETEIHVPFVKSHLFDTSSRLSRPFLGKGDQIV